jgi:ElaB/YqjD/DUF883 family membrane-anchored ribosome-binding protein
MILATYWPGTEDALALPATDGGLLRGYLSTFGKEGVGTMATTRRKTSTTARLRNGAHGGVDAVADSIDSLRERAHEYVDQSRERAGELAHTVEDSIHNRPVAAMLMAAAVGFVLGCFMSRR